MTIAVFTLSLLGAMALGMPIAFALIVCGIALMHSLDIFDSQIVAQNIINGADSFPLMAVPFFMLAGEIMNKGGLAKRIVEIALALVGHVKGGLGYVAIFASCALASLSGSAAADAAALASLLVPMMVAAGHKKMHAAGLVAAGGIIAPVIPPSIGFVLFGVAGGVSISKLFLAGIVPGLLLGVGLCFAWWWVARGEDIESPPRKSTREIAWAIIDGFWALMRTIARARAKYSSSCVASSLALFVSAWSTARRFSLRSRMPSPMLAASKAMATIRARNVTARTKNDSA